MRKHLTSFRIQLYDVDAFGDTTATTYLRFMWQAAMEASTAAGFSPAWYADRGTTWLIRRTQLSCARPAAVGEDVEVVTWVADIRRVRSQREYELRQATTGEPLARASTDWVYVDGSRNTPLRVPEELQRGLMPDGVVAHERRAHPTSPPPAAAFRTTRRIEFAAIDTIGHVNNTYYPIYLEQDLYDALAAHGWPVDPLARDGRLFGHIYDLEHLEGALYGDTVAGIVWVTEVHDDGFTCEHVLEHSGGHLLHSRTAWRWSRGELPNALRGAAAALDEHQTARRSPPLQ